MKRSTSRTGRIKLVKAPITSPLRKDEVTPDPEGNRSQRRLAAKKGMNPMKDLTDPKSDNMLIPLLISVAIGTIVGIIAHYLF